MWEELLPWLKGWAVVNLIVIVFYTVVNILFGGLLVSWIGTLGGALISLNVVLLAFGFLVLFEELWTKK